MKTNLYRVLALLCCLLAVRTAPAEGIEITSVSGRVAADTYQFDARLAFNFDPELIDAIEHGVAIIIDVIILIREERKWLWDPKVKEETLSFRLEQHPLSNRYLVTDLATDSRRQFPTLQEALDYLGTIQNYPLIDMSHLAADKNYVAMIKAEVNTETLPPVIRSEAAVSKKWQLNSPWHEWMIEE